MYVCTYIICINYRHNRKKYSLDVKMIYLVIYLLAALLINRHRHCNTLLPVTSGAIALLLSLCPTTKTLFIVTSH